MKEEDYVSFEVAKDLNDKGYKQPYDEDCYRYGDDGKRYWYSRIGSYETVDKVTDYHQRPNTTYPCASLSEAQKWLREEKQIWVYVYPEYYQTIEYRVRIVTFDNLVDDRKNKGTILHLWFEKYEQALNLGIREALKMI